MLGVIKIRSQLEIRLDAVNEEGGKSSPFLSINIGMLDPEEKRSLFHELVVFRAELNRGYRLSRNVPEDKETELPLLRLRTAAFFGH
ncbi:hypothetical protein AB4139_14260 [Vibrio cyclitrophicus]